VELKAAHDGGGHRPSCWDPIALGWPTGLCQRPAIAHLADFRFGTFVGTFVNGERKRGKFFHDDTLQYDGEWMDNMFDGKGTKYHKDGTTPKYTGDWYYSSREGEGKSFRADGTLEYDGEWGDNLRDGEGKSFGADGKTVEFEGEWRNGVAQRTTKRARSS
jgi:hypothetical protein